MRCIWLWIAKISEICFGGWWIIDDDDDDDDGLDTILRGIGNTANETMN
jgi:hypothetical protein